MYANLENKDVTVVMNNSNSYRGEVIDMMVHHIVLRTEYAVVKLKKDSISEIIEFTDRPNEGYEVLTTQPIDEETISIKFPEINSATFTYGSKTDTNKKNLEPPIEVYLDDNDQISSAELEKIKNKYRRTEFSIMNPGKSDDTV